MVELLKIEMLSMRPREVQNNGECSDRGIQSQGKCFHFGEHGLHSLLPTVVSAYSCFGSRMQLNLWNRNPLRPLACEGTSYTSSSPCAEKYENTLDANKLVCVMVFSVL